MTHYVDNYKGELYDELRESHEAHSAFLQIEPLLIKRDWQEVLSLLKHIAAVLGVPSVMNQWMPLDFEYSEKLLGYSFPELIVADDELKNRFRARWSFITLLEASLISPGHWLVERELIALLLGRDYDVALNPSQIHAEGFENRPSMVPFLPTPHSTSVTERSLACPIYPKFARFSIAGRRCITFALHCNFKGSVVDGSCLREFLREDYVAAVDEFAKQGLLGTDLQPSDYLPHLTNDALNAILRTRGINPKDKKSQLVDAVKQSLSENDLRQYVSHLMNGDDQRIAFQTGKLRRMLYDEKERFSRWGVWLRKTLVKEQQMPVSTLTPEFLTPTYGLRGGGRRFKAVVAFASSTLRTITELPIWTAYWDEQCDLIVSDYGKRLGWNAFREAAKAITSYWGPIKAARFAAETHELPAKLHLSGAEAAYNSVLDLYCEARRLELRIQGPTPQNRLCEGCNLSFSEDSIPPNLAGLAGYYLGFCRDCLTKAFYRLTYSHKGAIVSREELIAKLADLCGALEQIPQAKFAQSPELPFGIEREKAKRVIAALMSFPEYDAYVTEFGSWFRALIATGVLADEPLRMARGFRSVASDGHECYSLPELTIDNWLSSHAIAHEKEPPYPYHRTFNPNSRLRADWRGRNCYIEYFGMMELKDYRDKAETKVKLAQETGLRLLVILPEDIFNLDDKLDFLRHT